MIARRTFVAGCLWAALSSQPVFSAPPDFVDGEVLVIFKAPTGKDAARAALGKHSLLLARHYETISRKRGRVFGLVREKNLSTARLLELLKADPTVEIVEPNYLRRISVSTPNDPDFPKLWGLHNTGQTVNFTAGTSGVDTKFLAAWKLARPASGRSGRRRHGYRYGYHPTRISRRMSG